MDIEQIKSRVRRNRYFYSQHGDKERIAEPLTAEQVEEAILSSQVLEQYPDTGRGPSCLLVGFSEGIPIHIVCGWQMDEVSLITVYVPKPPTFLDPWTRRKETDAGNTL